MKPIDIKEVAKRFTEKYYPQWLSRFEMIWEMFQKTDLNKIVSDYAKSQYQLGGALGITGAIEPETKDCIGVIAVFGAIYQDAEDEGSIGADEVRKKMFLFPNIKLTPGAQQQLEDFFSEMLPLMTGGDDEQIKIENKFAKAWTNETGAEGKKIDKQKFEELKKIRSDYDIFIIDNGEYERDAVGSIYFKGNEVRDFTSLKYRILFYTLSKNGFPREAINIIENCWFDIDKTLKDLKKLWTEKQKNQFHANTNFLRSQISKLNQILKKHFGIRLITKGNGLYRLDHKTPKYCVIKIDSSTKKND